MQCAKFQVSEMHVVYVCKAEINFLKMSPNIIHPTIQHYTVSLLTAELNNQSTTKTKKNYTPWSESASEL
jgi:hypothetical protein